METTIFHGFAPHFYPFDNKYFGMGFFTKITFMFFRVFASYFILLTVNTLACIISHILLFFVFSYICLILLLFSICLQSQPYTFLWTRHVIINLFRKSSCANLWSSRIALVICKIFIHVCNSSDDEEKTLNTKLEKKNLKTPFSEN